ncbi:MAG TPA: hypothetical protein DEF42_07105, partial [Desulfosporosinus sp.]|nr:hypothetical protein [Desulfosporosinus sp.]
MSRKPRKKSETGIYHVIVRGIGQQDIFHEEDDFQRYHGYHKKDIARKRGKPARVLLDNQSRSFIAKRRLWRYISLYETLGISYAYWYNWKYEISSLPKR